MIWPMSDQIIAVHQVRERLSNLYMNNAPVGEAIGARQSMMSFSYDWVLRLMDDKLGGAIGTGEAGQAGAERCGCVGAGARAQHR